MKRNKFIALFAASLLLASCQGGSTPAASSASTGTSEASSEVSSQSQESSVSEESSGKHESRETGLSTETEEPVISDSDLPVESESESATGASESDPESEYVDLADNEKATIVIKDNLELASGEDHAVNLRDTGLVVATRSSDQAKANFKLSITVGEENVKVYDQTVEGLLEGDFTLLITAGKAKKAFHGKVVGQGKILLNRALEEIVESERYYYDSQIYYSGKFISVGEGLAAPKYRAKYLTYEEKAEKVIKRNYEGFLERDGIAYGMTYSIDEEQIDKNTVELSEPYDFEIAKGYTYTAYRRGYRDFFTSAGISGVTEFEKSAYKDKSGLEYYEVSAVEVDEYGTTNMDNFFGGIFGESSTWEYTIDYCAGLLGMKAAKIVAAYDEAAQAIVIRSLTSNNIETGFAMWFRDIGSAVIEDAEQWLIDGEVPEQIDGSEVNAFFDSIDETRCYTVSSQGAWFNAKGEVQASPSSWKSPTGVTLRGNYQTTTFVNEMGVVSAAGYVEDGLVSIDNTYEAEGYAWTATDYKEGDLLAYTEHEGVLNSAVGSYNEQTEKIEWEEPQIHSGEGIATNPWETVGMTARMLIGIEDDEGNIYHYFDEIASILDKEVDEETGVITFEINDAGLEADAFYASRRYYFSTLVAQIGDLFSFGSDIAQVGSWQDDYIFDNWFITLDPAKGELTWTWLYTLSSDMIYEMDVTFSNIGEDRAGEILDSIYEEPEPIIESSSEEVISETISGEPIISESEEVLSESEEVLSESEHETGLIVSETEEPEESGDSSEEETNLSEIDIW